MFSKNLLVTRFLKGIKEEFFNVPFIALILSCIIASIIFYCLGNPYLVFIPTLGGHLCWHHIPEAIGIFSAGAWYSKQVSLKITILIYIASITYVAICFRSASLLTLIQMITFIAIFTFPLILGHITMMRLKKD